MAGNGSAPYREAEKPIIKTGKFVQISSNEGRIFALDDNGRVWGKWIESISATPPNIGKWVFLGDE